MKKLILAMTLFCALLLPCFSQKEYDSYLLEKFAELTADYNEGESYYDQKEYEKAIEAYTKVFCNASFHYGREEWRVAERKKEIEDEFGPQFDSVGEIKLYYFSLYNIACCYSRMKDFNKAKEYLLYAIYAGYPYLNHIYNDADLKEFFLSDDSLRSLIEKIYNEGNSKSLVMDKSFDYSDYAELGFNEDYVIYSFGDSMTQYTDGRMKDLKMRGRYEVKNYHIVMHFDRETYFQPDFWATALGAGGIITRYSSYDPYPVYKDISYDVTLNWFYDYLRWKLKLDFDFAYDGVYEKLYFYSSKFKYEWEEKDYTELRKKRNEEIDPSAGKIKRTKEEIAASAKKRRQKVLDYIEKVGMDDSTVFVVPDGTKELIGSSWTDIDIPAGVVAVLIPEGVEVIDYMFPDTVKYINLPSSLRRIGCLFYKFSEMKILELPENIESISGELFSSYYGTSEDSEYDDSTFDSLVLSRRVYVPGWSDTPPSEEWHQEWDKNCCSHFGEYEE